LISSLPTCYRGGKFTIYFYFSSNLLGEKDGCLICHYTEAHFSQKNLDRLGSARICLMVRPTHHLTIDPSSCIYAPLPELPQLHIPSVFTSWAQVPDTETDNFEYLRYLSQDGPLNLSMLPFATITEHRQGVVLKCQHRRLNSYCALWLLVTFKQGEQYLASVTVSETEMLCNSFGSMCLNNEIYHSYIDHDRLYVIRPLIKECATLSHLVVEKSDGFKTGTQVSIQNESREVMLQFEPNGSHQFVPIMAHQNLHLCLWSPTQFNLIIEIPMESNEAIIPLMTHLSLTADYSYLRTDIRRQVEKSFETPLIDLCQYLD